MRSSEYNFESNSPGRKFLNFFLIPVLNHLPAKSKSLVRKTHQSVDEIIEHATTHQALELLYQKGRKEHTRGFLSNLAHSIWFNTNNAKAVRNRIRIVKREFKEAVLARVRETDHILILSIAAGSARAIIESLDELRHELGTKKVEIFFLDREDRALEYSKRLYKHYKLEKFPLWSFKWVLGTAGTYVHTSAKEMFDIIEMVGLLDYFDDSKGEYLFKDIWNTLKMNGVFITANICPNQEQAFITKVVGWKMIYRSPEALKSLLVKGGFGENKIVLRTEPLGVHAVAVVEK